jgi:RNA polymerase sigma-54 factor
MDHPASPALLTTLKQSQHLIMSPQMQQAIHLLQVPVLEILEVIEQEMEQNPLLEYVEETSEGESEQDKDEAVDVETPPSQELVFDDADFSHLQQLEDEFIDHSEQSSAAFGGQAETDRLRAFIENTLVAKPSLYEHLVEQIRELLLTEEEQRVAEIIAGSLDEDGFLSSSLEELAVFCSSNAAQVELLLKCIQALEPPGVGARSLKEALLLQLERRAKRDSMAYQLISHYYDELLHNHIPVIAKNLCCSTEEVAQIIQNDIAPLDLHPGLTYSKHQQQPLTADIVLRADDDGQLVVEVNDDYIPPLRLNRSYLHLLKEQDLPKDTKDFIKQKVMSAKWLMRNILQRNDTLTRIAEVLTNKQHAFLTAPQGQLVPLTMKAVADELELHESTVARAVANKYIETPRGLLSMRSFFTNAYVTASGLDISSNTVRQAVAEFIEKEDKRRPYSDQQLSCLLQERGMPCARRTVAKYRVELGMGNAQQRRRY